MPKYYDDKEDQCEVDKGDLIIVIFIIIVCIFACIVG